jgi:DNA-binding CsgD family transcriptional regulator
MARKQKNRLLPGRSSDESVSSQLPSWKKIIPQPVKSPPDFCPETHPVPCPLGAAMFSDQAWNEIARSLRLSGQELRIVCGVFDDQTESAIAGQLQVSPHTIHTHCERLYRKVGVSDRVRLVLRVMEEYVALTLSPGSALPPLCANFAGGRCPLRGQRL